MVMGGIIGITGSTGFLGKELTKELKYLGFKYKLFNGNLLNKDDINKFYFESNITTVIHLAGKTKGDFEELLNINLIGTKNLIEIGIKYNLEKIIFTSSAAVYGNIKDKPFNEETKRKPVNFYGISKLYAEDLIYYYGDNYKLSYNILRFPNIYSEKKHNGVISKFKESILEKGYITITGDGLEKRDFLHIEDCINSIILCILNKKNEATFNISSNVYLNILEVAEKFSEKYNFSIKFAPSKNSLQNIHLDYTRARNELGYTPKYNSLTI